MSKIEIENVRENETTEDVAAFLRYALFPSEEDAPENPFKIELIERYGSEIVAYAEDGRAIRIFVVESIPVADR